MNIQLATENIKLKFLSKPTHLSPGGGGEGGSTQFQQKSQANSTQELRILVEERSTKSGAKLIHNELSLCT